MALIDSLVAYWKLEEASGSRADSVGANTLTDNNTVTQQTGKVGSCAQFTSANSEYLSAVDNAALSVGGTNFTLAMWYYRDTAISSRVAMKAVSDGARDYYFYVDVGQFIFGVGNNVSTSTAASVTDPLPGTATWYYMVGWFDNTAKIVYLSINDGTVASTGSATTPVDSVGAFNLGRHVNGSEYVNGRVDEVGFWKRILTASEITFLYNGGAGRAYPFAIGPIPPIARRPASLIRASTR